ncbi:DUF445 domain-containing protein [Leptospira levettii]|uniref:DUF445 domain-containing protein n=1 Tax=Leptospira levettii TaxID=2023178 RepID=A0A2N0B0D9_9LEPT|nr:DUF445 domain-containing protein [Leptospira levettii]PKA22935.1 DUF445 domain-containing protein [Leptospira sp. mixed culture ATI2-C-A1]MCG6146681.1 DUF445 domain-containing protein [Leptospira levettii]MCW7466015.1 DUF445 domain-containing protein [Leptospira levettii]MCW7474889.1 DUF445 domain-containing protein [Leptospira levettii]MCW7496857.1 DUF445 domain-containing protein [Leptospira levettii]
MIPFTYGFVGWVTNWLALKMTFYPIQFIGIPPYLGWQGIIPRKAHKMASKSVDVITERLLNIKEVFLKVDPKKAEVVFLPALDSSIRYTIKEFSDSLDPKLWEIIPDIVKEEIYHKVRRESGITIRKVIKKLQADIDSLFDVKALVLKKLSGNNVGLVVELFQEVGAPEFRFIERSGFYFGFLLGLVQMIFMIFFPMAWTLPIQGVIVGYLTNYLALEMIFRPLLPKKILGLWTYQGLFLKRQNEVSRLYAKLVSEKILTPKNILSELIFGKASKEIIEIIRKEVSSHVDTVTFLAKPALYATGKIDEFDSAKERIAVAMADNAIENAFHLESYLGESLQIETMMGDRMSALPPKEFESILRSAFQEDEMLLILVGAALGALVGWFQMVFII